MSKRWGLAVIATALVVFGSALGAGRAEAGTSFSVGIGVGAPLYAPPPVYYAPPPPPVYYAPPAPVYAVPPAYGYVAPPVVVQPAPPVAYYGYYGPYRHWHRPGPFYPRPVRYW